MNESQDDRDLDPLEPVEELANEYVRKIRQGKRPSSAQLHEKFPELSDDVDGLAKTISMLEEASFRRRRAHPRSSVINSAGRRKQTLGGFRLIREISRGGMGIVYEAEQESLQRRVAVKVLPPSPLLTEVERSRFEREGFAIARLHHSNIVPVFGTGEEDGVQYCVMQYIDGCSLDCLIEGLRRRFGVESSSSEASGSEDQKSEGVLAATHLLLTQKVGEREESDAAAEPYAWLAPAEGEEISSIPKLYWHNVARIGADIADAVSHAHFQGVLHRDIKPGNLLLDREGQIWVADFGLAKIYDNENLTVSGNVIGTLRYSAPEQFNGEADARSDIYGLGLTLYELCTFEPAFAATERAKLVHQVMHEYPPLPRQLNERIPRDLETIILKAIASDPDFRYQTARDLAADLRNYLTDRPVAARRLTPVQKGWRWCRRHKAEAALGGFAISMLMLFAITATALYILESRSRRDAEQKAERHLQALDRVYDSYLPDWTTSSTVSAHGSISVSPESAELLEGLVEFYDDLADSSGSERVSVLESVAALRRVGLIYHRLGRLEKSHEVYDRALARLEELHRRHPTAEIKLVFAKVLNEAGAVFWTQRHAAKAYKHHQDARDLLEVVHAVKNEELRIAIQFETARTLYLQGRRQLGLDGGVIDRRGVENYVESAYLETSIRSDMIDGAVRILEDLTDDDPTNLGLQHLLGLAYREQSDGMLADSGFPADPSMALAIDKMEDIVQQVPDHSGYLYSLCRTLQWINLPDKPSDVAVETAAKRFQRSVQIAERLEKQHPDEWIYITAQIEGHIQLSNVFKQVRRIDEAIDNAEKAITVSTQLSQKYPDGDWFKYLVGSSRRRCGDLYRLSDQPELAVESYQASLHALTELAQKSPPWKAIVFRSLHKASRQQAKMLEALGRQEEARDAEVESERFKKHWKRLQSSQLLQ